LREVAFFKEFDDVLSGAFGTWWDDVERSGSTWVEQFSVEFRKPETRILRHPSCYAFSVFDGAVPPSMIQVSDPCTK
jgi:hypothetical protein